VRRLADHSRLLSVLAQSADYGELYIVSTANSNAMCYWKKVTYDDVLSFSTDTDYDGNS